MPVLGFPTCTCTCLAGFPRVFRQVPISGPTGVYTCRYALESSDMDAGRIGSDDETDGGDSDDFEKGSSDSD